MTTCRHCSREIEFRYVGGQLVPIHVDGNWCSSVGRSSGAIPSRAFATMESYTNPNALCPVCGETVFFYQSPHGGRVFFDALGWPWPKHPCTNLQAAKTGIVRAPVLKLGGSLTLRDRDGAAMEIYELQNMLTATVGWEVKFRKFRDGAVFRLLISNEKMLASDLVLQDLRDAPSYLVPPTNRASKFRTIYFICARLERVVEIDLLKA